MKKFFLIIFVVFCSVIFYQIVLGKNGLIEHYRIQKLKVELLNYLDELKEIEHEQKDYINYLKNDPSALHELAKDLGYFKNNDVRLVKVIDKTKNAGLSADADAKKRLELMDVDEINIDTIIDKKINTMRMWLKLFFYLFFGFFVVLIIVGGKKNYD